MWRVIKKSLAVNIVFVCVLGVVMYGTYSMVRRTLVVRMERRATDDRVSELILKKEELEVKLRELQIDQVAEREAKEWLNLKKPGEKVVVVVPEEESRTSANDHEHLSVWRRVNAFIFSFFK